MRGRASVSIKSNRANIIEWIVARWQACSCADHLPGLGRRFKIACGTSRTSGTTRAGARSKDATITPALFMRPPARILKEIIDCLTPGFQLGLSTPGREAGKTWPRLNFAPRAYFCRIDAHHISAGSKRSPHPNYFGAGRRGDSSSRRVGQAGRERRRTFDTTARS